MASEPNMTSSLPDNEKIAIRPFQYRDLEAMEQLATQATETDGDRGSVHFLEKMQHVRHWYGLLKCLSWFPNPFQYAFCVYVAEQIQQLRGLIKVTPFNRTRSTWRVEQVFVDIGGTVQGNSSRDIGSSLLRHCFEAIWEARTWLLEVNIHHKQNLALYRQNGFQPLAQLTYWSLEPAKLQELAAHEPDLPNLLPVSNADAQLLYQLDTASMPPLVRQVFDRHIQDFKVGFVQGLLAHIQHWLNQREAIGGYVFEPQRKAAIGYFRLQLCRDGSKEHEAELTVHPAYTCLYPELLSQMARIAQQVPEQSLKLASADYQTEREEYLEQLGAERIEHTLLMSRSVWHKLREAKPLESLQLSEMLQGLQPARTPIPSRMTWLRSLSNDRNGSAKKDNASSVPHRAMKKESKPSTESPEAQN